MALSNDIISQFVKVTKDVKKTNSESTVYGTTVEYDGSIYVRLDGSDLLTPASTSADMKAGERVAVRIKDHSATVTGNMSSPAARAASVMELGDEIATFNTVLADKISVTELEAVNASIENLVAKDAEIYNLTATFITAEDVAAKYISTEQLEADYIKAGEIEAIYADIGSLNADVGEINTLIFGSATGNVIQTFFSNSVVAQIGDAQIKSAMIQDVSASKITSGSIITNNVQVKSDDGKLLISDETIQISDDSRVRVQIGKDASNDYSINIWDAEGNLMFSEGGLTGRAIKDSIIRNNMISDDANISASKLDISSLFTEINGSEETIKATQIYLDDKKQSLDFAFKAMDKDVSSHGTKISVIEGQISNKIWKQDINEASGAMSTQYSTLKHDLDGFKTSVSSIKIGGRNLLIRSTSLEDCYSSETGGTVALEGVSLTDYIAIEPGAQYTFSRKAGGGDWFRIAWFDADENIINRRFITEIGSGAAGSYIWTAPEGAHFMRVSYPTDLKSAAKCEIGNKPTDWSPAPEDVTDDISAAQGVADDASSRISEAETVIEQLSNSISMLVQDGNGTSLMTQEGDGWVFYTSDLEKAIKKAQDDLNGLSTSLEGAKSTIAEFKTTIDGHGSTLAHISIGTYENEASIELSLSDSSEKVIITNTRILFSVGGVYETYIDSDGMTTDTVKINDTLRIGGVVIAPRSNGNVGFTWKGVSS